MGIHAITVGDGKQAGFLIHHPFNTHDVIVQIHETTGRKKRISPVWGIEDKDHIWISFVSPPDPYGARVVIFGPGPDVPSPLDLDENAVLPLKE